MKKNSLRACLKGLVNKKCGAPSWKGAKSGVTRLTVIGLAALGVAIGLGLYYWSFSKAVKAVEEKTDTTIEKKSEAFELKSMTFKVGDAAFEMLLCPAGTFLMGSPETELGRDSGEAQHKVTITKPFLIGKYEVTQKLYEAVMEQNPSRYKGEDLPVENISYSDAKAFCNKLNSLTAADRPDSYIFSIPTEAQWEYACRAGAKTSIYSGKEVTSIDKFCKNVSDVGWYYYNAYGSTQKVGGKMPNAWGIYDMIGNVSELCLDSFRKGFDSADETDPCYFEKDSIYTISRGGSVINKPKECRSASRSIWAKDGADIVHGIRIVLVANSEGK